MEEVISFFFLSFSLLKKCLRNSYSITDPKWHNCCFNFPCLKFTTNIEVFSCRTFPFSEQAAQELEPNYAWLCNIYTHWQAQPILQQVHPYPLHWSWLFPRQFPHRTHSKWQQSSSHVENSKYDSLAETQWFSHKIKIPHHKTHKHRHHSKWTSANRQQQEQRNQSEKAHNFKLPYCPKIGKMENLEWIMSRENDGVLGMMA